MGYIAGPVRSQYLRVGQFRQLEIVAAGCIFPAHLFDHAALVAPLGGNPGGEKERQHAHGPGAPEVLRKG